MLSSVASRVFEGVARLSGVYEPRVREVDDGRVCSIDSRRDMSVFEVGRGGSWFRLERVGNVVEGMSSSMGVLVMGVEAWREVRWGGCCDVDMRRDVCLLPRWLGRESRDVSEGVRFWIGDVVERESWDLEDVEREMCGEVLSFVREVEGGGSAFRGVCWRVVGSSGAAFSFVEDSCRIERRSSSDGFSARSRCLAHSLVR